MVEPRSVFMTPEVTRQQLGVGWVVGCSLPKPEPGRENQDAAAVLAQPGRAVLVLADGVGGGPAGDRAARLAVHAVIDCLSEQRAERGYREAVLDGFERANAQVLALAVGAASTLAVAVIENGECRTFHAGDSAILLTGQRGRLKHWTVSHSPVGYAVEAGMLSDEDALAHEDLHLVLNCIGSRDMRIEVGPALPLAPRDTLVVGSDGLFDNLTTDEIVATVRKGDLDSAAGRLVADASARMSGQGDPTAPGKPDDLSFLLFRLL